MTDATWTPDEVLVPQNEIDHFASRIPDLIEFDFGKSFSTSFTNLIEKLSPLLASTERDVSKFNNLLDILNNKNPEYLATGC